MINGQLVKQKKFKTRAPEYKGVANQKVLSYKHSFTEYGGLVFDVQTEATKMMDTVLNDPAPGRVYCNDSDLKGLDFGTYDAGFFIAILPTVPDPSNPNKRGFLVDPDYSDEAHELMEHFNSKWHIGNGLYVVSAYATWDMAQKHYKDIQRVFGYALIGFSTPANLQILCENPEHYGLKKTKVAAE